MHFLQCTFCNALFAMHFLHCASCKALLEKRFLQRQSAQMQKSRQRLRDTGFQPEGVGKHLLEFSTT